MSPRKPKKKTQSRSNRSATSASRGTITAITLHVQYTDGTQKETKIPIKDVKKIIFHGADSTSHPEQFKEIILHHPAIRTRLRKTERSGELMGLFDHPDVEERPTALAITNRGLIKLICKRPC
jgi:hypothetical protein